MKKRPGIGLGPFSTPRNRQHFILKKCRFTCNTRLGLKDSYYEAKNAIARPAP
jgi:hypothetical protein